MIYVFLQAVKYQSCSLKVKLLEHRITNMAEDFLISIKNVSAETYTHDNTPQI